MFFIHNYQNIFDFLELEKIYNFVYKKDMFNSLASADGDSSNSKEELLYAQ